MSLYVIDNGLILQNYKIKLITLRKRISALKMFIWFNFLLNVAFTKQKIKNKLKKINVHFN